MSDRPVEELIGWKRYPEGSVIYDWIDESEDVRERAEVDDLAAWLIGQTVPVQLEGPVGEVQIQLCRNPGCVNPEHLEAVTHAENIRRIRDRQLTCRKAGHPRIPENLYVRKNGRTCCAECARVAARRKWAVRNADS